jgi:transmembrane sensor
MALPDAHIEHLLHRLETNAISHEEFAELLQWMNDNEREAAMVAVLQEAAAGHQAMELSPEELNRMWTAVRERQTPAIVPAHRIHFLRTAWFRYAAAIIILFGIGSYLYLNNQKEKPSVTTATNPVPVQNDVAPGGNKATLTLADGSKIILDSASDGIIAKQGNATIQKNQNKIIYPSLSEGPGVGSKEISYNTMTTPRGGQYQLTLPDGTQVWLNAESSITYPTAFSERERERRVSITGEAYFEVAKNKTKPFIVSVSSGEGKRETENKTLDIEVLGTHFNVNAYSEEPTKNITLLEGSVRLTSHFSPLTSVHTSLTLKPGQQGQYNPRNENLSLAVHPDVEQAVAWKNGFFQYNRTPVKNALRQFARWYDVEVVYENDEPAMMLSGKMQRSLNLTQALEIIKTVGIQYRIENRKLIIL